MVNETPDIYAIIGNPLEHSFSPAYFNEIFKRNNINAVYEPWLLEEIGQLPLKIADTPTLKGFNVTIPFKKDVMKFLDYVDAPAMTAGAVNTVKVFTQNGAIRLEGYNTDITGFQKALADFLPADETSFKALILGSGGASAAIRTALNELGIKSLTVSRKVNSSDTHVAESDLIGYKDLTPELIWDHRLIINTTPAGMYPLISAAPPFPWEYLSGHHYFFDLIYNPETTMAMKIAKAHGAKVSNGLSMLYAQADHALKIWQK